MLLELQSSTMTGASSSSSSKPSVSSSTRICQPGTLASSCFRLSSALCTYAAQQTSRQTPLMAQLLTTEPHVLTSVAGRLQLRML